METPRDTQDTYELVTNAPVWVRKKRPGNQKSCNVPGALPRPGSEKLGGNHSKKTIYSDSEKN